MASVYIMKPHIFADSAVRSIWKPPVRTAPGNTDKVRCRNRPDSFLRAQCHDVESTWNCSLVDIVSGIWIFHQSTDYEKIPKFLGIFFINETRMEKIDEKSKKCSFKSSKTIVT